MDLVGVSRASGAGRGDLRGVVVEVPGRAAGEAGAAGSVGGLMARDVDMRLPADEPESWEEPQDSCLICGAADAKWCDEAKHAAEAEDK